MEKIDYEKPSVEVLLIGICSTILISPGEHEGNEGDIED